MILRVISEKWMKVVFLFLKGVETFCMLLLPSIEIIDGQQIRQTGDFSTIILPGVVIIATQYVIFHYLNFFFLF